MKLKRYIVTDMRDAVRAIKSDLGPDAVIIHSQSVKPRGLARLWQKPKLEVLAALEEDAPGPRRDPLVSAPQAAPQQDSRLRQIEERLEVITQSLDSIATRRKDSAATSAPSPQAAGGADRLMEQGLAPDIIAKLCDSGAADGGHGAMGAWLRRALPSCAPLKLRGDSPDIVAFLGTTGVGKTTTIAKVAADLKLRQGKRIALVTADTFRVAAVPQLEIYADLLDVPLMVAYEPEDLRRVVHEFRGLDAVLIDTPGRSPADAKGLADLRRYVDAVPNTRSLLLVEAGAHLSNLRRVARSFWCDACDGLVLTKLDETDVFGPAISFAIEVGKPIFYFTTGQNVPQDIEPASSDGLVSLLLDGRREAAEPNAGGFVHMGIREMARGFSGGSV
ncbi:MAG: flagellar biosynthesis protein FlhF [Anaerolineae bacterium]